MALRDHHPPPPLEELCKIQLMRTALVKFIECKNFDEIVQGCFVRVLLEMRKDGHREQGPDSYYIAQVKGAKEGPEYSGFSWEKTQTKWHIIIELPPCFRATPNGNVVQLNSISNSAFNKKEYDQWVEMTKHANGSFIQQPQIQLRLSLLEEHRGLVSSPGRTKKTRGQAEDPAVTRAREEKIASVKATLAEEIRSTHIFLPHEDGLCKMDPVQLMEVERQTLDLLSEVRLAINERTKCRVCRGHVCSIVCYPCKHQVMCVNCAPNVTNCPAPMCGAAIADKFEAYAN